MIQKRVILLLVLGWAFSMNADLAQREKVRHQVQRMLEGVSLYRDLEYARTRDKALLLDLYLPEGEKNLPLVVWIHGGASFVVELHHIAGFPPKVCHDWLALKSA